MLLELFADFDIVDPSILKDVMQRRFGVCGSALYWLGDFLMDRKQIVRAGGRESAVIHLKYVVPPGSVLGPYRFTAYAEDVTCLLQKQGLLYHLFVDDIQVQLHSPPADIPRSMSTLNICAVDVCG